MVSYSLLQGIFPNQGSNPHLLHCVQILYPLSHQGKPKVNFKYGEHCISFYSSCKSFTNKVISTTEIYCLTYLEARVWSQGVDRQSWFPLWAMRKEPVPSFSPWLVDDLFSLYVCLYLHPFFFFFICIKTPVVVNKGLPCWSHFNISTMTLFQIKSHDEILGALNYEFLRDTIQLR